MLVQYSLNPQRNYETPEKIMEWTEGQMDVQAATVTSGLGD